ncbi:receptor-binding tail protein [Leuconostoc phage P793]|uniref:Receptor-binding tail protein n=1 Tax=Leuconostoc phage P793 TaxID=1262522 RepID=M4I6M9_9CAUD|nr:receptor binding tail protein [Leuconostoc phage P793]AFY98194.1 receptor-binding tail protein [Leuconostoc phage P793]
MTLANTELVYQSDYMNVSPSADGAVFSGIGNRIITGLVPTLINGAVQVTAGKALIQGRLFELTSTTTYTPTSTTGTQYLGLIADLTQQNQDGEIVQNNQYTVEFFTSPSGDLNKGDTKANIPIWLVNGTNSVSFANQVTAGIYPNWKPNIRYNAGDVVMVNSLNGSNTDNGYLKNAILKANISHTSSTTFPASSTGTWTLINIDAYFRTGFVTFGYGRKLNIVRSGNVIKAGYISSSGTQNYGTGTTQLIEKMPTWANPDINGYDNVFYVSGAPFDGNPYTWTLAIHSRTGIASSIYSASPISARTPLRGIGNTSTSADPEWLGAVPD